MITRFNKFENKINEDSVPAWFEEKISKPSENLYQEYGKPIVEPFGKDEIDENLKKLYNTPIGNLPIYAYAQLMDILEEDRINSLVLQEPLTKDSSMLQLAMRYYVLSIGNIIETINKTDIDFGSVDQETSEILSSNPITVGTIIMNSIVSWYSSKEPVNQIFDSLNTAVIKPQGENLSEAFEFINESKYSVIDDLVKYAPIDDVAKWISKLFKGGDDVSNIAKAADDAARASQASKLNISNPRTSFSYEYKPSGTYKEALDRISTGSDEVVKNLDNAPREIKDAVYTTTVNIKQQASGINLKNVNQSSKIKTPSSKTPDVSSNTSGLPTGTNISSHQTNKEEAVGFFERLKSGLEKKAKNNQSKPDSFLKIISDYFKKNKNKNSDVIDKRSFLSKSILGIVKFFTIGGFFKKIPKYFWNITKYGVIPYGLYWCYKMFEKNDNDSAKEPTRELLSVFEKDLANQKFEPFLTFDNMGNNFQDALQSADVTGLILSWCESLKQSNILSDSDYKKCEEQIKSDAFYYYVKAHDTTSKNYVNSIEKEWENSFDLPSMGLTTMGLAAAYSSVFHKFETQFYKGNIPLTADSENLDRPVEVGNRVDAYGQARNYAEIGDQGEDIKLLQQSLNKLGIYTGEIDGIYDEEIAKIIVAIQTNAKPTNTEIEINGKADLPTLNYIAKQIEFMSGVVTGSMRGSFTPESAEKREQTQRYIQQMQAALDDR